MNKKITIKGLQSRRFSGYGFLWSWCFGLIFLLTSVKGFGQNVSQYGFSQSNGSYSEITGGTQIVTCNGCGTTYDSNSYVISLPNSFLFNGVNVTSVVMRVDGSLVLGSTSTSSTTTPISATTVASGVVSALGMDLRNCTISGIEYELRWQEIGEEYVFQWKNASRWSQNTVERFSFQIRISKINGVISIVYGEMNNIANSSSYIPQVGLRGSTNSDFNARRLTTSVPDSSPAWDDTAAATSNGQNVRFTSGTPAAFPSAGLTFTWTPPIPCSGTPTAGIITTNTSQNVCSGSTPAALTVTGTTTGVTGLTYQWEQSFDNDSWSNATGGTGATTATFIPPSFAGTTIYYRCKVTCTDSSLFDVSNVATIALPVNPTTQTSNLTFTNISYSGFNASWTNGNGNRRMVILSDAPIVDPTNGSGAAPTVSTVYSGSGQQIIYDGTASFVSNISGLNLSTTYYVKVYEYTRCGSVAPFDFYYNTSSGANENTVTTLSPDTVPWVEGFSTVTLPSNWNNNSFWSLGTTTALNPAIATNYIYYNLYNLSSTGNFQTPVIGTIPSAHRLVFRYKLANYDAPHAPPATGSGNFIVAISTNNGTTYTNVSTIVNNAVADWQSYSLDLASYVGQNIRIRLTGNRTSGDYYLAFDNFAIEPIPACESPASILSSTNITATTATINWAASVSNPAEGYEWEIRNGETVAASGTVEAGILTADVNGLSVNTAYTVWVRSKCGNGDFSAWMSGGAFSTTQIPATLPYTDDFSTNNYTFVNGSQTNKWAYGSATGNPANAIYISNDNGVTNAYSTGSTSVVQAYRDITIPAGATFATLSFDWLGNAESCCDYLRVWLVPTSFSPNAGTQITAGTGRVQVGGNFNNQTTWQIYNNIAVNVSSFAGSTMRLVFEWRNDSSAGSNPPSAIDNVNLVVPTCQINTVSASTNITATTATINWTASTSNPAEGYEWEVRNGETVVASGTVASGILTANVSGLSSITTFAVRVRANCGGGDFSEWVSGGTFTTTQIPATLPYTDDFSANNFTFVNGSQTNRWAYGSATGNTANSIYVSNNGGTSNAYSTSSTSVVHAYREIEIPAGETLVSLNFDWKCVGESGYDYIRVWLVPTSFIPTAGTSITAAAGRIQVGGNLDSQNTWQTYSNNAVDVSSFAGSTMRLVFEWTNDDLFGSNPPAAIDNVSMVLPNTIWNGTAWSNGEPTSTKNAIIQGDYTTTANLEANTLTVDSGVFTIASGTSVTVEGAVVNNAAATNFIVENNGNLLQNATAANVGAITVRANSQPLMRLDYTLWSSPVAGQNLKAFSPNTLSPRFYVYDETATTGNSSSNNGTYVTVLNETNEATYNFEAAQGYLIRTPNNHPTTPTVYNGVFTGVPQNGNYSATLSTVNAGYNLVGNPYPSSIDLNAFFTGNSAIENTVWFWRKTNGAAGDGYVTANNLGYTFPGQSADGATNIAIRSGQGFFVKATGAGSVSFTNGMRATNTTSTFFRNATASETPSRIWLQVANSTEVLASALVGYTSAATLGVDAGFDSKPFGTSSLVSLIGTEGYAIQGRSSFEVTDQVALGFEATTAGNYSIAIANKDGVFASGQAIYLQDLALNITHDFANGAYQFVSEAGTFNNRFRMVYENETLGIDDVVANQAYVYNNNGVLTVASTRDEIKSVVIFDIQGRVLQSASDVNANQWQATAMAQKNQVLLVQVTTAAGVSTTKTVF